MMVTAGRAIGSILALLGVLAVPRAGQAQLSVNELEVFLQPAGAERTGVIRVTNDTDKPVQALLELQDWRRDETGANHFSPTGSLAGSCKEQLKVFPLSVRIDAHGTEAVRVSFDGAADQSCWGIVFIQASETPRPSTQQSQITYVIRTGVKVYVQPANAARAGELEELLVTAAAVTADSAATRAVELLFNNTGQAHLKAGGVVEVRSADNQIVATLKIEAFPIAPGDARRLRLPLPVMPPGRYVALALIDYAGPDIAAAQTEFEIP